MRKIFSIAILSMLSTSMHAQGLKYPDTKKVDITDNYFGTTIADPYRWLEDDTSAATADWVRHENSITQSYIGKIPYRQKIHADLTRMWDFAKYSGAAKHGDYIYFYKEFPSF